MEMANSALDWLQRYGLLLASPERTRGSIVEALETGDVLEDGSILCAGGLVLAQGRAHLTERKARAAAYYGWAEIPSPFGFRIIDGQTGQRLFTVGR